MNSRHWTILATLALAACGGEETSSSDTGQECIGAKCDTPVGDDEACLERQGEVLDSSQRAFTPNDLRWACADVEGVNTVGKDDRGQEYCEYYAIFQPPPEVEGSDERPEAVDLARNTGPNSTTAPAVCFSQDAPDNPDCRVHLTEDQQFALEDSPDRVVGSCVFTTWHSDVAGPLPACDPDCGDEGQVHGFEFTAEFFRMKDTINSNRAAADLVARCAMLDYLDGEIEDKDYLREVDWDDPDDNSTEPFFRGCVGANELFGTGWRRSDPSVCAVANRLRECGCTAEGLDEIIAQMQADNPSHRLPDGRVVQYNDLPAGAQAALALGDALVPPQPDSGPITKRGFELGTWDDREGLPPGCRFADTGEDTQSVVLCDITAADLLSNANDPKEFCRATYGNNVVVHVPIPAAAISCTPPDTPEAATCGQTPWNIGQEGTAPQPEPEPEPEPEPTPSNCHEDRSATGEAGCDDPCIEACVCKQDSFCCDNTWDNLCAGQTESLGCNTECA